MQNWNQWQVPTGPMSAAMPQPPVGYPSTGSDPMAIMQAYMQYYNQPAPSGYTAEQWATAQQQNWAQWTQWQQQYQQWQSQYGDKYQETMKQYSAANISQPPPLPTQQPPLPKDDSKPPLPPDPAGSYNFTNMPPPHQNNLPLFPSKQANSGQVASSDPPLPPANPPLPADPKQSISDKSSADSESAKKMKLDEEKLIEIEKTFDAQFKQWEEQFNTWKQKNANHPDKEQYKQYEAKWTSWREKLLERREQMRRKREQQKQAAKVETEKKKDLGENKIMNILSNTENQGLINNLLGIGKTLGLTGKQESTTVSSSAGSTASTTTTQATATQSNVPVMQSPQMTPDLNQQSWAAQQWAAQYNSNYGGYQMPPPSVTSSVQPNMTMPPPNFVQATPNFAPPTNFTQQPPNYMQQPPPNFSQPPPNFTGDGNMFNKPPPMIQPNANKGGNESMSEMNRNNEDRDNLRDDFKMNERNKRMDDNRFGSSRFGPPGNEFSPNRFDSSLGQNRFNDRFNKGNDRFDNKNDRFGNRFGSNDRFGNNRFDGNKSQNDSSADFDNELAPELRKLMEKRKAALDAFKPRSTFLDPEKTLNVGSLRESFKKITGDSFFKSPFKSANDDNSSSMTNRSPFGPRGGGAFGPRGSEFDPRGPPPFGQRGPSDFDNSPRGFGPRGSNFGPRGACNFGMPRPSNFAPFAPSQPIEKLDEKKNETKNDVEPMDTKESASIIDQPPMDSPKMPDILKDSETKTDEPIEDEITILPTKNDKKNDDIEIISATVNVQPWHNSQKPCAPKELQIADSMNEDQPMDKNENLPFMDEDDPKPTDLNMEPPPEFPNLGPVITTPMDPPPDFINTDFTSDEPPKDLDNRFDDSFNCRRPPPFGMRGSNNFSPRAMSQPFNSNQSFSPRPAGHSSFAPRQAFSPRGPMDGPNGPFGNRPPMNQQQFTPRGMNQSSFGPRGGNAMDGPPPNFSSRSAMDGPSNFGPPPFRNFDNFNNRLPFSGRDSFAPDFNQSSDNSKKIPSLFDLKFESSFKSKDPGPSSGDTPSDFKSSASEFKSEDRPPFSKDLPPKDWSQPPPSSAKFEPPRMDDFAADNVDLKKAPPQIEKDLSIPDKRLHDSENGSNYDPFEMFKNRDRERKPPIMDFCAKKQYNYNHGVGTVAVQGPRPIHDHVPVKVFDYNHNPRRVDEIMANIESYDYGHGQLKPTVPDQIYPLRRDFRNWEESEQNLREYSERMQTWECEMRERDRMRTRDYKIRREDKWREEMMYRENKKRHVTSTQWDADAEFKKMKYDKEAMNASHYEDKRRNKEKVIEKASQEKNFADDDFLEEISWDGDNDRSLKDVNEETKNDDNSNLDNQNGSDGSKKLDIAKTPSCTNVDDILCMPGRQNRPPKIVIILRGPPGSGKSFVAKLIKDKEVEQGGSAPRILSIDDYFLVEKEVETKDDNGKKITTKEMVYEYEEIMEPSYTSSLAKAFKKNITDGFFNFIILDSINEKISDYEELWSFAKTKGFKVYVCEMEMDPQVCIKRNIHKRSEDEINRIIDYFEPTPSHHQTLDVNSVLQEQAIEEVQMMDSEADIIEQSKPGEEDQDSQDAQNAAPVSKWEQMDAEDKLDRLDGLTKHKYEGRPQTMEDFLQVPDYYNMEDNSGKKRVRWADLEERKEQEKMRAVGFVVGHTNWDRMMDPTKGSSALTRTKYI